MGAKAVIAEETEAYWENKKYKKWVVLLGQGRGKKEKTETLYVGSKTDNGALDTAILHCSFKGAVNIKSVRLAHPISDLGGTPA